MSNEAQSSSTEAAAEVQKCIDTALKMQIRISRDPKVREVAQRYREAIPQIDIFNQDRELPAPQKLMGAPYSNEVSIAG